MKSQKNINNTKLNTSKSVVTSPSQIIREIIQLCLICTKGHFFSNPYLSASTKAQNQDLTCYTYNLYHLKQFKTPPGRSPCLHTADLFH